MADHAAERVLSALASGSMPAAQLSKAVGLRPEPLRRLADALGLDVDPQGRYRLPAGFEPLDSAALQASLATPVDCQIERVEVRTLVDSTNTRLLLEAAPAHGYRVLLAERQSHGHGRRGRSWLAPLGDGICLSMSWASGGAPGAGRPGYGVALALAVAERLGQLGGQVAVKWPNDLYVRGRKLGGILLESAGQGAKSRTVVGLGLNYRFTADPVAGACDLGHALPALPGRNEAAAACVDALLNGLTRIGRGELADILARWPEFDAFPHATVTLESTGQTGRVIGLDREGRLRVRVDGQEQICGEADVRFAQTSHAPV